MTVKGTFKHDQTVTGTTLDTSAGAANYGWAHAECATGYVESTAPLVNYNGVATGGAASDQYIPPHINNYLFNGWYDQTATAKTDPAWTDPTKSPPKPAGAYYPSSTAVPFEPYGSDWMPHRFDYKSALTSIPFDGWDLGLEWGNVTKQFKWMPLVHDGGDLVEQTSFPSGFVSGCSSEHTYGIRIKGDGRPIYFVLRDLVHYAEWDNCGALSIHVEKSSTGFVEPDDPPSYGCHYVPEGGDAHLIDMDAPTEDRPDAETYFAPERTVLNQMKFKISTGTVASTVQWRNYSRTHHSITAAIDKNGNWCGNLIVPNDLEPTPDDPEDDKVPLPLENGAKDDCRAAPGFTQVRLFECDWFDCLQKTLERPAGPNRSTICSPPPSPPAAGATRRRDTARSPTTASTCPTRCGESW